MLKIFIDFNVMIRLSKMKISPDLNLINITYTFQFHADFGGGGG